MNKNDRLNIPREDRCVEYQGFGFCDIENRACPYHLKGTCKVMGNLKGKVVAKTYEQRMKRVDNYMKPQHLSDM